MKNREIPVNLLPLFPINVRKNAADYGKIINDEILFLSHKHMSLEAVCRVARGQDQSVDFGGLKVLLCGNFYQFLPAGNPLYNDEENSASKVQISIGLYLIE